MFINTKFFKSFKTIEEQKELLTLKIEEKLEADSVKA